MTGEQLMAWGYGLVATILFFGMLFAARADDWLTFLGLFVAMILCSWRFGWYLDRLRS